VELSTIIIDIEVHRWIEGLRRRFDQSPNDILRELAKLPPQAPKSNGGADPQRPEAGTAKHGAWSGKRVTLEAGTELRMTYNGRTHTGLIAEGAWQVEGATHTSPSAAAGAVAGAAAGQVVSLNGWRLWEVRRPGERRWVLLDSLRPAAGRARRTRRRD
jgi:hypothetical protein